MAGGSKRAMQIDSSFALDVPALMSDIGAMTETGEIIDHKLQMLVLERRNASPNMARFYDTGSHDFAIRWNLGAGGLYLSEQMTKDMTELRICAMSKMALDQRAPSGKGAALLLAERIEIDLAEPRQDYRLLKLACRRIAGARERKGTRVFERERAGPPFGDDRTHDLLSLTGLQVAFLVPIECDDDMIGHRQFQTGFKSSAEDLPVRLSATIS